MRKRIQQAVLLFISVSFFNLSCQKETQQPSVKEEFAAAAANNNKEQGHLQQTKTFHPK